MDWRGFIGKRVSRSYFWLFMAAIIWVGFALPFIEKMMSPGSYRFVDFGAQLIATIGGFVLTIGRMHDVNKSGWFAFLPIYNIVVPFATKGDPKENRFGPPPLELSQGLARTAATLLVIALILTLLSLFLLLMA